MQVPETNLLLKVEGNEILGGKPMMKKEEMEPLLDAREVAKWLGVAPSTVYDAVTKGILPAVRMWKGKRRTLVRFRRQDVEAFINERAVPARKESEGR